jgi:hypothetical protein
MDATYCINPGHKSILLTMCICGRYGKCMQSSRHIDDDNINAIENASENKIENKADINVNANPNPNPSENKLENKVNVNANPNEIDVENDNQSVSTEETMQVEHEKPVLNDKQIIFTIEDGYITIEVEDIQEESLLSKLLIKPTENYLEIKPMSHICKVANILNPVLIIGNESYFEINNAYVKIPNNHKVYVDLSNADFTNLQNILSGCWHNVKIKQVNYKIFSILLQLSYININELYNCIEEYNYINIMHAYEIERYSNILYKLLIDKSLNIIVNSNAAYHLLAIDFIHHSDIKLYVKKLEEFKKI